MQPNQVLSVNEFRRLVFSNAVELGWPGRHPLLLDDDITGEAFRDALRFLNSFGRSGAIPDAVNHHWPN
jgi:hypothetical protein